MTDTLRKTFDLLLALNNYKKGTLLSTTDIANFKEILTKAAATDGLIAHLLQILNNEQREEVIIECLVTLRREWINYMAYINDLELLIKTIFERYSKPIH